MLLSADKVNHFKSYLIICIIGASFCGPRTIFGKADHPWMNMEYVRARFENTRTKGLTRYS